MVHDGFYEESASSQRSAREAKFYMLFFVLSVIFLTIGVIVLFMAFQAVPLILGITVLDDGSVDTFSRIILIVEYFLLDLCFLGAGVGGWFFKNRFNVSFDYTFVEDEVRITKVFNGKRRKHLYTLTAEKILQIGWVESDAYDRAMRGLKGAKPFICTPNREPAEGKEMIYVMQTTPNGKGVYILECRRQLLENIVFVAGRNKLEQK